MLTKCSVAGPPSRPSRLRPPTCVGHGLSSAPAGTDSWRPSASARPTSRFAEFHHLTKLLNGRRVQPRTPLYVNAGRWVYDEVQKQGITETLEAAGVRIVTDTCTYNTPILPQTDGLVLTNSAKWAWYAPRNIGVDVLFADLEVCVESAIAGTVIDHDGF